MGRRRALLLMDANVLIDYLDSDRRLFSLASAHVGQVHVPAPLLAEEIVADEVDWAALGVVAAEPSAAMFAEAGTRRGSLSFHDWLCVLMAKHYGWTCVTNDKRLRRECADRDVPTAWGLELVVWLVEARALSATEAMAIAEAVAAGNPGYLTAAVKARLAQRVRAARGVRRGA